MAQTTESSAAGQPEQHGQQQRTEAEIMAIEAYLNSLDGFLVANGMHDHDQRLGHIEEVLDNLLSTGCAPEAEYGPADVYAEQLIDASGTSSGSVWWRPGAAFLAVLIFIPSLVQLKVDFGDLVGGTLGVYYGHGVEFEFFDLLPAVVMAAVVTRYYYPALARTALSRGTAGRGSRRQTIATVLVVLIIGVAYMAAPNLGFSLALEYEQGLVSLLGHLVGVLAGIGLLWSSGFFSMVARGLKARFQSGSPLRHNTFKEPFIRIDRAAIYQLLPPTLESQITE